MTYITGMRNTIEFQISCIEKYEYFKDNIFQHRILCNRLELLRLYCCLSHALSNVVKSHFSVHNFEPFFEWKAININNDGLQEEINLFQQQEQIGPRYEEYAQKPLFLVATFGNAILFCLYQWRIPGNHQREELFTNTRLAESSNNI